MVRTSRDGIGLCIATWINKITAVFQGKSRLALARDREGGGGVEVQVKAGDVRVILAGVSHSSLSSEGDYRYIVVYPDVGITLNAMPGVTAHI